jgi:mycothiol synthase
VALPSFCCGDAFALDAAAGRSGTILHVDTNNPTPALGLYLSVGMTATLAIDVWRRVLPLE